MVWHDGKAFNWTEAFPLRVKGVNRFREAVGQRASMNKVRGGVSDNGGEVRIAITATECDHIKVWT